MLLSVPWPLCPLSPVGCDTKALVTAEMVAIEVVAESTLVAFAGRCKRPANGLLFAVAWVIVFVSVFDRV